MGYLGLVSFSVGGGLGLRFGLGPFFFLAGFEFRRLLGFLGLFFGFALTRPQSLFLNRTGEDNVIGHFSLLSCDQDPRLYACQDIMLFSRGDFHVVSVVHHVNTVVDCGCPY